MTGRDSSTHHHPKDPMADPQTLTQLVTGRYELNYAATEAALRARLQKEHARGTSEDDADDAAPTPGLLIEDQAYAEQLMALVVQHGPTHPHAEGWHIRIYGYASVSWSEYVWLALQVGHGHRPALSLATVPCVLSEFIGRAGDIDGDIEASLRFWMDALTTVTRIANEQLDAAATLI
jgi:hypothetical protein